MTQPLVVRSVALDVVRPFLGAMRDEGLAIEPVEGTWLGAYASEDDLAGVARLSAQGGVAFVDDVWVEPEIRGRGAGSALIREAVARATPLWLICDEDMVTYYASLGFARVALDDFPPPLGDYFGSKGEWREASDHVHVAMVAVTPVSGGTARRMST